MECLLQIGMWTLNNLQTKILGLASLTKILQHKNWFLSFCTLGIYKNSSLPLSQSIIFYSTYLVDLSSVLSQRVTARLESDTMAQNFKKVSQKYKAFFHIHTVPMLLKAEACILITLFFIVFKDVFSENFVFMFFNKLYSGRVVRANWSGSPW